MLNPGPADDNIDNILREVLNVQDLTCSGEGMTEVDDVPVHQGNIRAKVHKTIKDLRNDQLTANMPPHRFKKWKELLTRLENLSTRCYESTPATSTVPATRSTDTIPSTSGISRAAAADATTTIDNHSDEVNTSTTMDEQDFGTENTEFLEAEILEVTHSDLDNSLPDFDLILKHDKSDVEFEESEMHVTTFRAKDKFERINDDTTLDTDTDNE